MSDDAVSIVCLPMTEEQIYFFRLRDKALEDGLTFAARVISAQLKRIEAEGVE